MAPDRRTPQPSSTGCLESSRPDLKTPDPSQDHIHGLHSSSPFDGHPPQIQSSSILAEADIAALPSAANSADPFTAPPAAARVNSSAISILSTSGTLVSRDGRRRSTSTLSPPPYSPSPNFGAFTSTIARSTAFDPPRFKSILHELNGYLERFDSLNDQLLEAMTTYDEISLGLDLTLASSLSSAESFSLEEHETKPTSTKDLEEGRRLIAQSIADLISDSWPRICMPITTAATTSAGVYVAGGARSSRIQTQQQQQQQQQTAKLNKQRIKIATQLKNDIVAFWTAQSLFQEKAQLILDIYQDPTELEHDDRIRILRSRHLNNLLSNTLSPEESASLAQKFKEDQEKMASIAEPLQGVWHGLIFLLEGPDHCDGLKARWSQLDSGDGGLHESFGRKLIRIGKSKRQAFKSLIRSW